MPDYLRSTPQVTLAAEDGGSLISRLSEALADEGNRRYCDIDLPGGTLTFEFDSFGVMGIWIGASAEAPSMTTVEASGETVALAWRRGPEGKLYVSGVAGPWADGRLEMLIGVNPQRRLVFSL